MAAYRRSEEKSGIMSGDFDDDERYWNQSSSSNPWGEDDEESVQHIRAQISISQRKQDESLKRSLAVVVETEQIGRETAEELVHQGEQLDNAEKKLDSIEGMTKVTQRHLNSIKSVFGGIKNWFQQKNEARAESQSLKKDYQHSRLKDDLAALDEKQLTSSDYQFESSHHPHPAASLSASSSGRFDDDEEDDFRDLSSRNRNDETLDAISNGLSNLKMLGLGMGRELDAQNDQIHNRLMPKAERCDDILRNQNKQMRQMLN